MKKLIILIALCINFVCGAQNLISVSKPYGHGHSLNVIQPTIENFITMCDMTDTQFVSAMKAKGYFPTADSGNPISYWNGSIDNFAYAFAVNTWEYNILSDWRSYIVKKEYIYPSNSMIDFIKSLKPYYYTRKCVIYDDKPSDVFKIERNGKVYAIFVTDFGDYYYVHARIFPE